MRIEGDKKEIDNSFALEVQRRSGENVFLCYQCRKCASGCPLRDMMDSSPTELMRFVQLGMKDRAEKDSTVWRCTSCQTCTARCPQGIDIAHIVDTVKMIAQEEKTRLDSKNVKAFNVIWMNMLKYMGRIYEVGLVALLNMAMKNPLKGAGLAVEMVKKGKLKFMPTIKRSAQMRRMFKRAERLK